MSRFHDDMTLAEAREILNTLADDGVDCPCCRQYVKVYDKKKAGSALARVLIAMYGAEAEEDGWIQVPTMIVNHPRAAIRRSGRAGTTAKYWGLIEQRPGVRGDGSHRSGYWRLTAKGRAFVEGKLRIPKYARTYDDKLEYLHGDPVDIRAALGSNFDYAELMTPRRSNGDGHCSGRLF